jgi:citrate lyase subunit beta/citryl-CoA lyase
VEKALTLEADVVIVDLEDSVAIGEKAATRKSVAEALARPRKARGYVRVNAPSSEFCYRDLAETLHRKVDGVVVPKIESAADLHAVDWLMANLRARVRRRARHPRPDAADRDRGRCAARRPHPAGAQPAALQGPWRVKRVAFGGADYAHQLGLTVGMDEAELADAKARVVLSSRAAGMEGPIDSPWFHFRRRKASPRSLERSRRNGFQGRLCVHPDQIAPVNAAYLPSAAELERAERIVAAFKQAEAAGQAAIQVDGEMVDYPVAYRAQTMIDAVRAARKN